MLDCSLDDIPDHIEKWYANIGIETPFAIPKDSYIKAFASEYIGEDHVALCQAMDNTVNFTYSHFLPIVQLSGMGKSKAVLKVSEDRVILQACIRPGDESQGNAVPAQDRQVYRYLTSAPKPCEGKDCKNYFAAFLVALFRSTFKIMHNHGLEDEKCATKHLLTVFTDNCTCHQFWEDVVAAAEGLRGGQVTVSCLGFYAPKEEMSKKYQQGFPLFLCLHEAHSLFRTSDIASKEPTLYSQLRSAAADLCGCDYFRFIVLSTFSGLHTGTSFRRGPVSLEECNRIDFITTFGCPLWQTFFNVNGPDLPHLMDMIKTKILCWGWPEIEGKSPVAAAILTILSSRLYLTAAVTPVAQRNFLLRFTKTDSKPYFCFWDHVIGHIAKHENHGGHIGELISRTFSIDAMDRVILEKYPSEATDPPVLGS
ncbi:hypothetical protein PC9H_001915 [Pleurotus ostreatus]|uniref:Uncharacterized protein n=1 Tax=Pleurotus ostreatus TaxID=5322 RepID=A0A8H6ZHM5_PLEOS|nr:uncharacterized protein PC9H_001915 [Pleurotus ostreatus]KAF7419328.1 hypothetical protein PC9H_001915 [Pleurotus ostreatus]